MRQFMSCFVVLVLAAGVCSATSLTAQPPFRWMGLIKTFLANQTVPDMVFPGTHDSGAYKLYDTVVPDGLPDWLIEAIKILRNDFNIELPFDIIRNWATTQQYNYYNQLARGIRFLDIRVVWDGTTFRTAHMIVGDPIEDLIDQVEQFLIESEEEILVLQFGDFAGFTDTEHQAFIKLMFARIGGYLWPRVKGYGTYSQMVASGQRVLAFYDNSDVVDSYKRLWDSGNLLISDWANVDNFPKMLSIELQSVLEQSGNPQNVYKLQWVLTASPRRIIDSVADPVAQYKTLHDLTRGANSQLDAFLNMTRNYRINLLMTDFFEETDNVDQARILNMMNCNDNKLYRAISTDGNDCRSWRSKGLCSTNSTVAQWCPLTCGTCKEITGKPGDGCASNRDCLYGICHPQKQICLTDVPRVNGDSCGRSFQCISGKCNNFNCIGDPIGSPCSGPASCGSKLCLNGVCAGEKQFITKGSRSAWCNSKPLDCESDPRGLTYIGSFSCGSDFDCLDGGVHVICANYVIQPTSKAYWVGSPPLCGSTYCHGNDTLVLASACGPNDRCLVGRKSLCLTQ